MPAADGLASYAGDGGVVAPQCRGGVHRPASLIHLLRKLWPAELRFSGVWVDQSGFGLCPGGCPLAGSARRVGGHAGWLCGLWRQPCSLYRRFTSLGYRAHGCVFFRSTLHRCGFRRGPGRTGHLAAAGGRCPHGLGRLAASNRATCPCAYPRATHP